MNWLITAFEPFGGQSENSSQIVLRQLQERRSGDARFGFIDSLPVSFERAWPSLERQLTQRAPRTGVLALGQAERRDQVSLEQVAINWCEARIADNDGLQPENAKIHAHGRDVIWSTIDWSKLQDTTLWSRSYNAGSFVCNTLMYNLFAWSVAQQRRAGFIHIPSAVSVDIANELDRLLDSLDDL